MAYREPEEIACQAISILSISIMAVLFGRKSHIFLDFKNLKYARALVAILFVMSWAFTSTSIPLLVTNFGNQLSCDLSTVICILLYGGSKIVIYMFFIERVHLVTFSGPRLKDKLLILNHCLLLPYTGIVVLLFLYRVATIMPDGHCLVGIDRPASLPLVLYDIFISIWLTFLFVRLLLARSIYSQGKTKKHLHEVARRTMIGSVISLIISTLNGGIQIYTHGLQRGWICLISCTLDVTFNACTVYWIISPPGNSSNLPPTSNSTVRDDMGEDDDKHGTSMDPINSTVGTTLTNVEPITVTVETTETVTSHQA